MKLSDKKIVERQVNRIYRSSVALDESVIYDCACVLTESLGISDNVSQEVNSLKNEILSQLKTNGVHKIIDNAIGQTKVSFLYDIFDTKFKVYVSVLNFGTYSIWQTKRNKFIKNIGANIDPNKKTLTINIESIEGEFQPQTFEGSLQHEIQHYYEIEKSNYSWESESNYKLAQRLMDCRYNEQITNGNVRDFLYLFGLLFYLSFKQEREGYANGLYAYLKNCGRKLDKNTIHRLAKNDETHTILKYLMILNDCLSGITNDNDIDSAIEYLNGMSDDNKKQYTKEKITKMCSEILRDMQKRINNAKYHALGLNETILYPLNVFEHNNFLNWKK